MIGIGDCRTNEEFSKSHFEDALNIPYMFKTDEGDYSINLAIIPSSFLKLSAIKLKKYCEWFVGRVINPDFLPQVALVCKKDEHLIVVRI